MEAGATQQREDWIRSNERALHYYGGGVQVIIPDNLQRGQSLRPLRTGHQPPVRGVDLRWAGPPTSFAIGSRLALSTDAATYWRAIRVGSGYVPSDSPARPPRQRHRRRVGEAFGYLPGAELLLTGWPVPRRASPLPMLLRSGSRSWKPLRRRSPGAAARPQCQAPSRAGREVPDHTL